MKQWIMIMAILILAIPTFAQVPPPMDSVATTGDAPTPSEIRIIQQVKTEAQNTRKFVIDTYEEKSVKFWTEADSRMAYMENKLDTTLDTAVITLSLVFAGVCIFVCSMYAFFGRMMERARYKKLEKSITENIMREMTKKVDTREDGYVTMRHHSDVEKQMEIERIRQFQEQQRKRAEEQELQRQMAQLQGRLAEIRNGGSGSPIPSPPNMQPYSARI